MRIGLTGGIACGKSSVSALLAERGAVIIDSDVLAREAVAPGTWGLGAIVRRFGREILTPEGSLDRARLGEIVFADPAARQDLNAIVHPEIRRLAVARSTIAPPDAVVVHVIPLLAETDQSGFFDRVVVVDCTPRTQVKRLMARNDYTLDQAQARIASQAARADRLAVATDVINNDGSPMDLVNQIDNWWRRVVGAEPVADPNATITEDPAELPIPVDHPIPVPPVAGRGRTLPNKGSLIASLIAGMILALVLVVAYQFFWGGWRTPGAISLPEATGSSSLVVVGDGVSLRPPPGWVVDKVDSANRSVTLNHGSFQASLTAMVASQRGSATEVCQDLLKQATTTLQEIKEQPVTAPTPNPSGYGTSACSAVGKRQGTDQFRAVRIFVSVRESNHLTVATVLSYNPARVPEALSASEQALVSSLVESQQRAK